MKNFSLVIGTLALSGFLQAAPIIVDAPVDHIFVPRGFDNNDNVEVVVTGNFPSTCYARHKVDVSVKEKTLDVHVTALLNQDRLQGCERVMVSYAETVTVGVLEAGAYKVVVNGKLESEIRINTTNSSSVDENLYAMIDYVELGFTGGVAGDAMLVGKIMDDCMKLDRIEYLSNGNDTISVMPILKKTGATCSGTKTFFEAPIKFRPRDFRGEKILLFVRTMDGKSIQGFVDLR